MGSDLQMDWRALDPPSKDPAVLAAFLWGAGTESFQTVLQKAFTMHLAALKTPFESCLLNDYNESMSGEA